MIQAPSDTKHKMRASLRTSAKLLQENNIRSAKHTLDQPIAPRFIAHLKVLTRDFGFSIRAGELQIINANWYVTHTGLIRLARRKRCCGIQVEVVDSSATARLIHPTYGSWFECRIADADTWSRQSPWQASSPFFFWFAFPGWGPQAIHVLVHLCQGAIEKELDLLIRRAVLPFREFSDPRFKASWYSDKQGDTGFVHLQVTKKIGLLG